MSSITFIVLFSQEKPLRWKEINTYTHTHAHTRTHTHTRTYVRTYVPNGWLQTNAVERFLCIGSAKYTRASPPARTMLLFFIQFEYAEFSDYVYFVRFRPQISFLGKFWPKNQNYEFILKFGTWTNSNMQNSMAMFNFSAFYWNYPFWANLVQPIKIVRLSWNLVPRLIRIRRI